MEAITEFVQQAKAIANTARDNATIKGTTSSGTYAAADDTKNITVKIEGVADQDIEVTLEDTDTLEQAATKIATALNDGTDGVKDAEDTVIGGFTATVENGQIKISNSKGIVANVSGTISGITFNGEIGNSTRTTSMNQYNEILDQIDQLAKDPTPLQPIYLEYVRDLQSAAPSLIPYIAPINENIINNDYYSAIKNADRLVKKEEEFFGKL